MIDTTYDAQVIITEGEYTRLLYVERNFEEAVKSGIALRKDQYILTKVNSTKMYSQMEINLLRSEYTLLMTVAHSAPYISYWMDEYNKQTPRKCLEIDSYKGGKDIVISSKDYNHLIAVYNNFLSVVNDNTVLPTAEEISEVLEKDAEYLALKETISSIQKDIKELKGELEIKRGGLPTPPDKYKSYSIWWLLGGLSLLLLLCVFRG